MTAKEIALTIFTEMITLGYQYKPIQWTACEKAVLQSSVPSGKKNFILELNTNEKESIYSIIYDYGKSQTKLSLKIENASR